MQTTLPAQTTHDPIVESVQILEPLETTSKTVGLGEVVRLAFESLVANKVRALLTMLGVIIGVASVVTLLSLGEGASASITGQFSALGTNVLNISPGQPGNRGPGSASVAVSLTMKDVAVIERLNLPVVGPSPRFNGNAQVVASAADKSATIAGIQPVYREIESLSLASGSFIDESHVQSAAQVTVLGHTLAQELFGSGQAIGQTIRINNQTLRVIGVVNEKGGGLGVSVDDMALVPITLAQQRLFGGRTPDGNDWQVSSIAVSVTNTDDIPAVEEQIKIALRGAHELDADGSEDDFNIINQASFLDTLNTITTLFTWFLGAVAGISLLVGGIGIMNIMLVSVTERTREIGLRKAVGARSQDILLQFVVEALVLSTVGGLIGLLLGSILPVAATALGLLEANISLTTVTIAVGFSMAVGLFFGIYPARRAAQLNPIQALRHE
jgi:putative ABC transport system permease protein